MGEIGIQSLDTGHRPTGVLSSLGLVSSPPFHFPLSFPGSSGSGGSFGPGTGGPVFTGQRGSGTSFGAYESRLLRSPLPGPQTVRGIPTGSGPQPFEPLSQKDSVQNGDSIVDQGGNPTERFCYQNRPERCLLPCTSSISTQEVPPLLGSRPSVPVQGPPVRPIFGTLGFYQNCSGIGPDSQEGGDQAEVLPGRLVCSSSGTTSLPVSHYGGSSSGFPSRLQDQSREIYAHSESIFLFPRDAPRYDLVPGQTFRGEGRQDSIVYPPTQQSLQSVSQTSDFPPGTNGVPSSLSSSGETLQEAFPERASPTLVSSPSRVGPRHFPGTLASGDHRDLEISRFPPSGSSYRPSGPSVSPLHGCLHHRLGSASDGPHSSGPLVRSSEIVAYQQNGVGGSLFSSPVVPPFSERSFCDSSDRQHNSRLLHSETRGGTIRASLSQDRGAAPVLSSTKDLPLSQAHSGENQYSGRLAQSTGSDHSHRMVHQPRSSSEGLENIPQTLPRPFCDQILEETEQLRQSGTRPRGLGRGRPITSVDGSTGLRLPPSSSGSESSHKAATGKAVCAVSGSRLASSTLVSRSTQSPEFSSTTSKFKGRRSGTAQIGNSARQPSNAEPSRLALLRSQLSDLGVSGPAIELAQSSLRKGSNLSYQSHWARWSKWCLKHKINPLNPTAVNLANFLAFLFFDLKLASATIKASRSAICSTLNQLGGPCLSSSFLIRDVLKGASLKQAKDPRRAPLWDLFLVLSYLTGPPFEPLKSLCLKNLTLKTVFLVMLATGRRSSEIKGLSGLPKDVLVGPDESYRLNFLPDFLAKNQTPGSPSPTLIIKPLLPFVCSEDPEANLCPVRALRRYRHFTNSLRTSQRQLFISFNNNHNKDVSKTTIARWIRLVILKAYADACKDRPLSPRAHELRAWSSSLAFQENWNLEEILSAAFWKSKNAFIDFYLRDIAASAENGTSRLSCVAASTVCPKK